VELERGEGGRVEWSGRRGRREGKEGKLMSSINDKTDVIHSLMTIMKNEGKREKLMSSTRRIADHS
jgi:hypothetical protein